ncbi:MAG TPA: dihydroxy-acid dehydratase [Prolixibacteraceae bacterium]|jgi:aryl-phospho-beta-D-glucosidase BglC (GH1 family)|nr:dihydroxy-acid dehydratase [Prolixibacteraceae bacterium]
MKKNFTQFAQLYTKGFLFVIMVCGLLMSVSVKAQLSTAQHIASKMKIGWNLGNTLEATWVPRNTFGTTTQAAIDSVKAKGFNTVRIPVAWFYHSDTITSKIDAAWLSNVKKVVDYCIKDSMYVIINAHWDKGWLENRVNTANKDIVNKRQQAYWTQIATYFKDYNDHLLFAGANEPNVTDATSMAVLLSYHQTFINAVRATGGNNSSRTLIIQGPSTDIDKTNKLMNTLPVDQIEGRLMVEVHYYTPWNFCGMNGDASWGKMFYYWGKGNHSVTETSRNATWGEESDMDKLLGLMKTKYIDKGIPVIIGEYGAFRKKLSPPSDQTLHNASIEYYYRYFMKSATSKGFITYCWDTGGLFNFTSGRMNDRVVLNAIVQGAKDVTTGTAMLRDNAIEIYPNPFRSTICLKTNHPEDINRVAVYDMMGHQVETVEHAAIKSPLDLGSSLKPDLYIVQVNEFNWTRSFKVLKMQ